MLPWNATLAVLFASYLQEVKAAIGDRPGVIAYEDTHLPTKPRLLQGEALVAADHQRDPAQKLGRRRHRAAAGLCRVSCPYAASDLPDLGRFRWRD
jgi:hypothetical protein